MQAKETVIRGLGECTSNGARHPQSRWNLGLGTRPPAIPYRETIAGTAESRYRHKSRAAAPASSARWRCGSKPWSVAPAYSLPTR